MDINEIKKEAILCNSSKEKADIIWGELFDLTHLLEHKIGNRRHEVTKQTQCIRNALCQLKKIIHGQIVREWFERPDYSDCKNIFAIAYEIGWWFATILSVRKGNVVTEGIFGTVPQIDTSPNVKSICDFGMKNILSLQDTFAEIMTSAKLQETEIEVEAQIQQPIQQEAQKLYKMVLKVVCYLENLYRTGIQNTSPYRNRSGNRTDSRAIETIVQILNTTKSNIHNVAENMWIEKWERTDPFPQTFLSCTCLT